MFIVVSLDVCRCVAVVVVVVVVVGSDVVIGISVGPRLVSILVAALSLAQQCCWHYPVSLS